MRRFSSRNQLVTLNDINITPLLDLAFVLLIIFIITTPLLEQSISVRLPNGGDSKEAGNPSDVVTAEVSPAGIYYLKGHRLQSAAEMERLLVAEYRKNPKMIVRLRADANGAYRLPISILNICKRNGITRFDIATEPELHR